MLCKVLNPTNAESVTLLVENKLLKNQLSVLMSDLKLTKEINKNIITEKTNLQTQLTDSILKLNYEKSRAEQAIIDYKNS